MTSILINYCPDNISSTWRSPILRVKVKKQRFMSFVRDRYPLTFIRYMLHVSKNNIAVYLYGLMLPVCSLMSCD